MVEQDTKHGSIYVYGCGTPIRQNVLEAIASGSGAIDIFNEEYPKYRGGISIIWGLMRGAKELMAQTTAAGFDYYQIDNAYFGRETYFRLTKNGTQLSNLLRRDEARYKDQFSKCALRLSTWKKKRGEKILICTSSPFLYEFYNTSIDVWLDKTVPIIKKYTQRPIAIREKQLGNIEHDLSNSWILVTHSSASALDALLYGLPVVTTEPCAASPMSTLISEIERPRITANRASLFASLAWGQYTLEEMKNGFAWKIVNEIKKNV